MHIECLKADLFAMEKLNLKFSLSLKSLLDKKIPIQINLDRKMRLLGALKLKRLQRLQSQRSINVYSLNRQLIQS